MYKALYEFKTAQSGCLSFVVGDQFTEIGGNRKGDWILAQNGFGEIGYIPSTYVQQEENLQDGKSLEHSQLFDDNLHIDAFIESHYVLRDEAALSEVLKSIDRAIEIIHYEASSTGSYTHQQRETLQKLTLHRENVVKEYSQAGKNKRSGPVTRQMSSESQKKLSLKRSAPPPPTSSSTRQSVTKPSSTKSSSKHTSVNNAQSLRQTNTAATLGQTSSLTPDGLLSASAAQSMSSSQRFASANQPSRTCVNSTGSSDDSDGGWVKVNSDVCEQSTTAKHPDSSICDVSPTEVNETAELKHKTAQQDNEDQPVLISRDDMNIPKEQVNCLIVSDHNNMNKSESVSSVKSIRSLPSSPSRQFDKTNVINVNTLPLPPHLASELVGEVRRHTSLSYDKSCLAVEVVLSHIATKMPQTVSLMEKILGTFQNVSSESEDDPSLDGGRIKELFQSLTDCKDDAQQRSWALHEDQQIITSYLEELLSILENAKPSICRRAIGSDGYDCIHNLVQYYQMETRVPLRLSLLKVFGALCGLEATVISHLLYSILPLELVSEITNQKEDARRLGYVTLVLTMIFSTGEPVPVNLNEHMNEDFLDQLFEMIEDPETQEHDDNCSDLLVNLILAYNLHFADHVQNDIMSVLAKKGTVKIFTEKLLQIFNQGDDPVKMFDHQSYPVPSQIKFMIDMYSQPSTACLLYVNDAKVLIDIIIRILTDLQPGDRIRSSVLVLTKLLVRNSDYFEHEHRLTELCECLMTIKKEEAEETEADKEQVEIILQDFNAHM